MRTRLVDVALIAAALVLAAVMLYGARWYAHIGGG